MTSTHSPTGCSVVIVGAGFGGLAVALELKQAGIESFTVLERAEEVGGPFGRARTSSTAAAPASLTHPPTTCSPRRRPRPRPLAC